MKWHLGKKMFSLGNNRHKKRILPGTGIYLKKYGEKYNF